MARVRTIPQPPRRPLGVVRLRFGPFDRIVIDGAEYRCVESNDDGHILRAAHDENVHRAVSHAAMPALMDEPGFQHDRDWFLRGEVKARLHAGVPSLTHLLAEERELILFRYDFAMEFLNLEGNDPDVNRSYDSVDKIIPNIAETLKQRAHKAVDRGRRKRAGRQKITFDPPCAKTLLRWVKRLTEDGLNPLALRDRHKRCGNRSPRFSPEEYELIAEFAQKYLVLRKPSIRSVYEDMQIEIAARNEKRAANGMAPLKRPSYELLRQEVEKLPKFEVMASREGIEKAMKHFRPVSEGIQDVYRPFQHTEMDHWNVQLHTICQKAGLWGHMSDEQKAEVERARYVLGLVVCRRTRCFAALRLTRTATAQSAVELLEMAVSDKREYALGAGAATPWDVFGTMSWMFADGGFANTPFKTALAGLHVNLEIPPNGLAHMRGMIERSFRLMHEKAVARFDGRTFKNIIEKGDYNSEERAGNFVDELAVALVRYAIDVHHNTPHPSLNYETPRQCWGRLTEEFGVSPPPDWRKRRHVFGVDVDRVLGPAGVRFLGLQYRSERLHEHFKKRGGVVLQVRVHEGNLGEISVRIDNGWLTVPAPEGFEGVPAGAWIAAEADLRRRGYRTAEVTAPIRLKAISDINRMSEAGRRRIGIDDERTTARQLLAAERQMQIGIDFREPGTKAVEAVRDHYDGALTVGPPPSQTPEEADKPVQPPPPGDGPVPQSRPPKAKRRWTFKD